MRNATPTVSVVICTRDRPDVLEAAMRGVLASDAGAFELIVVDQSGDDASAGIVARIATEDARLRLIRDAGAGLSRARNIGLTAAVGDIIAFTDDDCVPATDWLRLVVAALADDLRCGIVFGSVVPAPCDPRDGFIVGYTPPRRQRLTGRFAKRLDGGIGANMTLRRATLAETGGFDEMLGAGGYFASCEDGDMAYRVLSAGWALVHVPESRVVHFGLRDWASGSGLTRRTYAAVAAAYMKHARRRDPVAAYLVLQSIGMSTIHVMRSVAQRRRPVGLGRLFAHFTGIRRSFELKVDRATGLYVPPASTDQQ